MTAEVDELIERLSCVDAENLDGSGAALVEELCGHAADALSRLQREREACASACQAWRGMYEAKEAELQEAKRLITDYEEVIEDKRRICREIDVAMFGKNAAKQPSLCDIQASVVKMVRELQEQQRVVEGLQDLLFSKGAMDDPPCFVCGYNGEGYYQPSKHPCAERHHAAIKEKP